MAVAVGLDDGPQLAALRSLEQAAGIRADRGEIDLQRRARHASSRPSGSSRSVATIAPASATASRAAEPCATAASASASAGGEPAGAERADGPGEHVARARRGELRDRGLDDAQRLARCRDERVGALEQHGGARALRRLADAREACAPDRGAVAPEQAPELAGVRRERRRAGALAERLEPAREREERVGVEHERRLDAAHESIDQLGGLRGAPEAGARDDGARTGRELEHALRRRARRAPSAPAHARRRRRARSRARRPRRRPRPRAAPPAPPAPARRSCRASRRRRARRPRRTSCPHASAAGTSARSAGSRRSARAGPASAPGRPIGSSRTSPAWPRPGSIAGPERAAVERQRQGGIDRDTLDAPARAVHPARHVERDDRRGQAVGAQDERLGGAFEAPVEAAAEERVDDHIGASRARLRGRRTPSPPRASCGRPPSCSRARRRSRRSRRDRPRAGDARRRSRRRRCCRGRTGRRRSRRRRSARARRSPRLRRRIPSTRFPAARARGSRGCRARVPLQGARAVASLVHANARPASCRCLPRCSFDALDRRLRWPRPAHPCAHCS